MLVCDDCVLNPNGGDRREFSYLNLWYWGEVSPSHGNETEDQKPKI